jgi:hypothetical protein
MYKKKYLYSFIYLGMDHYFINEPEIPRYDTKKPFLT